MNKKFLEPPLSVYIKEHTTSDSATGEFELEGSSNDFVDFRDKNKESESKLSYMSYPCINRPYDIQYSLNKDSRGGPKLPKPDRVQKAKTHLDFVVGTPESNVYESKIF